MVYDLIKKTIRKRGYMLLIVFGLTIVAAVPRFYELGSLSFYGDEETTALPARSLAEGKGAKMPGGMPYYRALPLTWLNAQSANLIGIDREISYRIPAALLGTLTVPLLFVLARPLVGSAAALVAALLLALSEWHILTSREARMYAPFLFFYVATGFAIWRWATTGAWRHLLASVLLFAATVSLHKLAFFAALFALIPIVFRGWAGISPLWLSVFALIAGASALIYSDYFVLSAFGSWIAAHGGLPPVSTPSDDAIAGWLPVALTKLPAWAGASAFLGGALGIWAAKLSQPEDKEPGATLRTLAHYVLATLMGALAGVGQAYGAAIAGLLFLLIHPDGGASIVKKIWTPTAMIALIFSTWVATTIYQNGLVYGLKTLVSFPFPYPVFLTSMFPGVFALFLGVCIYLALEAHRLEQHPLRGCILVVLLPITAVGLVKSWGGVRYVIEAYPFLLLVAAAGLVRLLTAAGHWTGRWSQQAALFAAVSIVASGLLGGHGIPQALNAATLQHGDETNIHTLGYTLYPDHQAPGLFVRKHLTSGDIIIAEDALQQWWYAGGVDYWLRDPATHRQFLYRSADGRLRDIYVNSVVATTDILNTIGHSGNTRVWIITSAETYFKREYYLDTQQLNWLTTLEKMHTPAFTGRDGITKVYCLNCALETSPAPK